MNELIEHVYNSLGSGHAECVYHRALEVALRNHGYKYESEVIIPIKYDEHVVGHFRCDLIIEHNIIIELKAIQKLRSCDREQLKNYMRIANLDLGMLVNFGPELEIETLRA